MSGGRMRTRLSGPRRRNCSSSDWTWCLACASLISMLAMPSDRKSMVQTLSNILTYPQPQRNLRVDLLDRGGQRLAIVGVFLLAIKCDQRGQDTLGGFTHLAKQADREVVVRLRRQVFLQHRQRLLALAGDLPEGERRP